MKRHGVCLQLRFEAPKDVKLEMLSRRAALSGNAIWPIFVELHSASSEGRLRGEKKKEERKNPSKT